MNVLYYYLSDRRQMREKEHNVYTGL